MTTSALRRVEPGAPVVGVVMLVVAFEAWRHPCPHQVQEAEGFVLQ